MDSAQENDHSSAREALQRTTFRHELVRAAAAGIVEAAAVTLLMDIAVRMYTAQPGEKAFLAAGGNYGLLLTPLVVYLAVRGGWRVTRWAAVLAFCGGLGFFTAAAAQHLYVYIGGSLLGLICSAAAIPLYTQMYQDNYPADRRGKLFSRTNSVRILAVMLFGAAAGLFLSRYPGLYRLLLVVFGVAMWFGALCLLRVPTRPIPSDGQPSLFSSLAYLRDDPLFRLTLISWMIMGIANLMMVQLRVEFLANPKYGPPLSSAAVAVVTLVIPNAARLLLSPLWGYLFDRMNFFVLRVVLNVGFAIGGLVFFFDRDIVGLALGAIVFGIANAGGDIAWSLWVTKLAPPGRVAQYMSVHTFFTGVRGTLAPHLGFFVVTQFGFNALSYLCFALIFCGSLLLVPEMRATRGEPLALPNPPPDE